MNITYFKNELITLLQERRKGSKIVGLVPTMGALHQGHLSLIKEAQANCDVVVVSIFVNPTQFNNAADLEKYPRNLEDDFKKLRQNFKDLLIFAPQTKEIYDKALKSEQFDFGALATKMEGRLRAGHFDGVGTILKKLFSIVAPDKAFFGEKDYQQLLIVKKLVRLLQCPVEIIGCPISRQENGLARSSRNKRLSKSAEAQATLLYKSLKEARENFHTKSLTAIIENVKTTFKNNPYLNLDYFEIADAETLEPAKTLEHNKKYRAFIAAQIGEVRLIDNVALN